MTLRKFGTEVDIIDPMDLPWVNVWRKGAVDPDAPRVVWMIVKCETGLMVCTTEYKGYIQQERKVYPELLEAIETFVSDKQPEQLMYVAPRGKKDIEILIDDEKQSHRWQKTENRYVQVQKGSMGKQEEEKPVNRFLAGRVVQKEQDTTAENLAHTSTSRKKSTSAVSTSPTSGS